MTYLEEIAHRYDADYYRKQEGKVSWLLDRYLDSTKVDGLENIPQDSAVVYMSNHRSHLDYLLICFLLFQKGFKAPAIGAGSNLFIGPFDNILRKLKAFYIKRSPAEFSSRTERKEYTKALYAYVKNLLRSKDHVLLFPEGGRSYDGNMKKVNSAQLGLIGSIIEAQQEGVDMHVIPTGVTYGKVVESCVFPKLEKTRKMKNRFLAKTIYYGCDLSAFLFGMLKKKTNVNVKFGKPISIKDYLTKIPESDFKIIRKKLAEEIITNISDLIEYSLFIHLVKFFLCF